MSNLQWTADRESPVDKRRRVKDGNRVWTVYEHLTLTGIPSLIFDCGEAFRRVRSYPADWAGLTDAALLGLCHAPVKRIALEGAGQRQSGETAEAN